MNCDYKIYEHLLEKEIIAILDGDETFGEKEGIKIKMPYLSGPNICDISCKFGLDVEYPWSGAASRWTYMYDLLTYAIENSKIIEVLNFLFSKQQFQSDLHKLPRSRIDTTYSEIVDTIFDQINSLLYFNDVEIKLYGSNILVTKINKPIVIDTPKINKLDNSYIKELINNANDDLKNGKLDSAITKARTLVEETFCKVIELKNEEPTQCGDISKLYDQVKKLYHMHQSKEIDKRINELLSGINKIISSISEMRNKSSDSHGIGNKRINIEEHHARLFLNAAEMISEFILEVADK